MLSVSWTRDFATNRVRSTTMLFTQWNHLLGLTQQVKLSPTPFIDQALNRVINKTSNCVLRSGSLEKVLHINTHSPLESSRQNGRK